MKVKTREKFNSTEVATKATAPRVLTNFDRSRLRRLLDAYWPYAYANRSVLDLLDLELRRARVVPPGAVPPDVVTMNSTVRIRDVTFDRKETFTVVFPGTADPSTARTSVLSPVGMAVLGRRAGDVVAAPLRRGMRPARIEEVVSQPEREGRFDL